MQRKSKALNELSNKLSAGSVAKEGIDQDTLDQMEVVRAEWNTAIKAYMQAVKDYASVKR